MNLRYKLTIDRCNANYISGWCYHRFDRERVITLCLRCDGEIVGQTLADIFREDLRVLDLHPTGNCGFELIIEPPVELSEKKEFTLTLQNSTRALMVLNFERGNKPTRRILTDVVLGIVPRFQPRPILLFMHIPKTAGTTFNTQVSSVLPKNKVTHHIELEDTRRYRFLARRNHYLSGHLRFGIFQANLCHGKFRLYTLVREPYAHLHSHLKWMIQTAQKDSDNYFKYSNRVIHELGRTLSCAALHEPAGIRSFIEKLSTVEAHFFDNLQTRYFCKEQMDRVTEDSYREAVRNLSKFDLIGITERYDDFVNQFVETNDLPEIRTSSQLNRSQSAQLFDITDSAIRRSLLPLVKYDLNLYEHIGARTTR